MIERLGRSGARQSPEELCKNYKKQLRQIQKFLTAGGIPTLYVAHRACISNPAEQAERINRFLGGNLDEAAMAAPVSDKLYRHRVSC